MSEYENAIGGKLKLKGKALGVKGVVKKKKKHHKTHQYVASGGNTLSPANEFGRKSERDEEIGEGGKYGEHLTAAERRYLEQWEKIDVQRLNKLATKSHRDRVQEFNHYLANLSEHYDIPKVGPG